MTGISETTARKHAVSELKELELPTHGALPAANPPKESKRSPSD